MSELKKRLVDQDPYGRVDVALAKTARSLVNGIERRTGLDLWNNGLGEVTEALIKENGVPGRVFTATDMARAIGILPAKKNRRRRREVAD